MEVKNFLICFESLKTEQKYQLQIYYCDSKNKYNHSTNIKLDDYVYDALSLDTNELVYFDGKVKFLNLDRCETRSINNTIFDFNLNKNKRYNIICKLDNNHILIPDNKYFYIINIMNYNIVKKISHQEKYLVISGIKSDSNGNIMILKKPKGIKICKPTFMVVNEYDYFIIYKYNNFNLEKTFELKESDCRIKSFHKYPDNQIVFFMYSRQDESKYIRTLIINS